MCPVFCVAVESDDELEGEGSGGPLLPPDDRLWRHPSELAFAGGVGGMPVGAMARGGSAASGTLVTRFNLRNGENRLWTVAIVSGVVGALLATGIVYSVGAVRTKDVAVPALERDVDSSPVATLASVGASDPVMEVERVRPSCVELVARSAHGVQVSYGVVFRSDGMMITTAHTLSGSETLTAIVGGNRRVSAHMIAADPATDLAVVKLAGSGYDPAPLGSALDLKVGDPVVSVLPPSDSSTEDGAPGDQGSVDALGQQIVINGGTTVGDLVKIDTTVPPTEVGAPVLDSHGAVVAISTATGAAGQAVEFATPVDLAREIATQLLATGKVVPVWLGIEGQDLTTQQNQLLGVAGGALVQHIYSDSPAAAGGVQIGDIVVGLDGRQVTSISNLIMAIHAEPPGTSVELDVDRNDREQGMNVVLTERPAKVS
jgi:S1-C subfamily serine protease